MRWSRWAAMCAPVWLGAFKGAPLSLLTYHLQNEKSSQAPDAKELKRPTTYVVVCCLFMYYFNCPLVFSYLLICDQVNYRLFRFFVFRFKLFLFVFHFFRLSRFLRAAVCTPVWLGAFKGAPLSLLTYHL